MPLLEGEQWLDPREIAFTTNGELNGTAYVFLGVGLLVIVGGLVWCFWKALQAAGRQDEAIPDTT